MSEVIDNFNGNYRFLSNFYMGGGCLPSVEHQYQAFKCVKVTDAIWVMSAKTALTAKRRGRKVEIRDDWEDVKLEVMRGLLEEKFEDVDLREALLQTGSAMLIEGNTWHDNYWGDCSCARCKGRPGTNALGELLRYVRVGLQEVYG